MSQILCPLQPLSTRRNQTRFDCARARLVANVSKGQHEDTPPHQTSEADGGAACRVGWRGAPGAVADADLVRPPEPDGEDQPRRDVPRHQPGRNRPARGRRMRALCGGYALCLAPRAPAQRPPTSIARVSPTLLSTRAMAPDRR